MTNTVLNIVFTVQRQGTTYKTTMYENINLVNRFNLFESKYKPKELGEFEPEINKYTGRELTSEEEMMKDFMKSIILNDSKPIYKIAQDYKRIIGADSNKDLSKDNIKQLVIRDKIEKAIDEAISLIPKSDHNGIVIIKNELKEIENNYISGISSLNESRVLKNQIIDRFLKILDKEI